MTSRTSLSMTGNKQRCSCAVRQRPFARDEIEGLACAVARHQDADLFIGNTALAGTSAPAAGRTRHLPGSFFRFQHIQLIGLGNAMQAMRVRSVFATLRKRWRQRNVVLRCSSSC